MKTQKNITGIVFPTFFRFLLFKEKLVIFSPVQTRIVYQFIVVKDAHKCGTSSLGCLWVPATFPIRDVCAQAREGLCSQGRWDRDFSHLRSLIYCSVVLISCPQLFPCGVLLEWFLNNGGISTFGFRFREVSPPKSRL